MYICTYVVSVCFSFAVIAKMIGKKEEKKIFCAVVCCYFCKVSGLVFF